MRLLVSALALLILPAAARADTIDDFVLTGEGQVITFSAPATHAGGGLYGAGGYDGGFGTIASNFIDNGVASPYNPSLQVFPEHFFLGTGGLYISQGGGGYELIGQLLYSGSSNDATFLTGTFHLYDYHPFQGISGNLFSLTITPEVSAVPEPPTLLPLATGIVGLVALTARNRVRSLV